MAGEVTISSISASLSAGAEDDSWGNSRWTALTSSSVIWFAAETWTTWQSLRAPPGRKPGPTTGTFARTSRRAWHCRPVSEGQGPAMSERHDWAELLAYDREHVWHPYAPLPASSAPLPVVSASGVRLRLADGRELVDAMSSWWTAIWGYRHPVLDAAVRRQLDSMAHVMFGGLTHAPAIELAQRLAAMAPAGLDHVFFADTGSVSVEVAMKTCVQYQGNTGPARADQVPGPGRRLPRRHPGGDVGVRPGGRDAPPVRWRPAPRRSSLAAPPGAKASTPAGRPTCANWPGSTAMRSPPSSPSRSSRGRAACGSTTPVTCASCER